MNSVDNTAVDYVVTEEGVFYEEEPNDEDEESDPLASESDGDTPNNAEREAQEEVFGASIDDLIAEARTGGRRRKRKRSMGTSGSAKKRGKFTDVPSHLMSVMGAATVAYMMKRFDEAEEALNRVIMEAPKAVAPYRTLGLIYEEKGEKQKALTTFMAAAEIDKQDRDLWKRNAALWEDMGEPDRAIYCLSQALRGTHGKDADALRARGMLYLNMQKFRMAADSFVKLSKLVPADINVGLLIYQTYRRVGEEGRAVPPLEDMLRNCEQNAPRSSHADAQVRHEGVLAELTQMVVEIRFRQDKYYDASLLLGRMQNRCASTGRPMTFVQRLMFAVCQHRLGSETLASPTFLEFMSSPSMVTKHRFLLWQVADACRDGGDYGKALRAFGLLAELDDEPNRTEILLRRAICHKEMGNRQAAREDLESVLYIEPRHVEASLRITEFLAKGETFPSRNGPKRSRIRDTSRTSRAVELLSRPSTAGEEKKEAMRVLDFANALYNHGDYKGFLSQVYPALEAALQLRGPTNVETSVDGCGGGVVRNGAGDGDESFSGDEIGGRPNSQTNLLLVQKRKRSLRVSWADEDMSDEERTRLYAVGANVMRIVDNKSFVDLAEKLVTAFREEESLASAHDVTRLFDSLTHLRVKNNIPQRARLKMLDMATSFSAGDAVRCYEHARNMLIDSALDPDLCYAFSVADQYVSRVSDAHRIRSLRFMNRLTKKNPTSLYLLMVAGTCSAMGGINTSTYTVGLFLRAFKLAPHNPLICLCVAVQMLYVALSRRVGNRNEMIIQAFAFLDDYRRSRTRNSHGLNVKWCEMEADYNVGRIMHQLGLVHMAADMYRRVLDWKCELGADVPMWADLRRDAAYNLVQIYRASGSIRLANVILEEHLTF